MLQAACCRQPPAQSCKACHARERRMHGCQSPSQVAHLTSLSISCDMSAWQRRSSCWALQRDRQLGAASLLNIAKYVTLQTLLLLRHERLAVLEQQLAGAAESAAGGGNSAASAADMARAAVAEARAALARQQEVAAEVHSLRQEAESYNRPVTPMRQIGHCLACRADKVVTLSLSWDDAIYALQTRQQALH